MAQNQHTDFAAKKKKPKTQIKPYSVKLGKLIIFKPLNEP